jgi:hypothetical protein
VSWLVLLAVFVTAGSLERWASGDDIQGFSGNQLATVQIPPSVREIHGVSPQHICHNLQLSFDPDTGLGVVSLDRKFGWLRHQRATLKRKQDLEFPFRLRSDEISEIDAVSEKKKKEKKARLPLFARCGSRQSSARCGCFGF